ncbi:MAG: basic amino acid ABC transporter substrate-binding protein [Desertifilum sp. SIO1I2]|nr:basic amino acid ABC transporter substrate-binding protein [Desertifilum sp. SIO1I2]
MLTFTRSRFLRRLTPGLVTLLLVAACGGNQAQTEQAGGQPLTVATEPAFPPFESQAAGGELEGFDIDLMNAIGEAADLNVQFQSLPFDGIVPALQAGQVDAAISAMTITPERQQTVDFSRPYFRAGLAIAVREDNTEIQSLDDLKNKRIAVQIGTTGANQAKSIEGTRISTFDSAPLALQELANGNVDAVINDAPVTLYAIESGNLQGLKVVGQLVTEEYYGIALPRNSPNLERVNQGLTEIKNNGTYAEIYQKWFGVEPPTLPETAPTN